MIRQAHSYLVGAGASAALIAAAVTAAIVIALAPALDPPRAPSVPEPGSVGVVSDGAAPASGAQAAIRREADGGSRLDGGSQVGPAVPALTSGPGNPATELPVVDVGPAPGPSDPQPPPGGTSKTQPAPAPEPAPVSPPQTGGGESTASTSGGLVGTVDATLRGVGQVTDALLGPSSLVGRTLTGLLGGSG